MNLKKCKNGHYYDADQNTQCPHCNDEVHRMDRRSYIVNSESDQAEEYRTAPIDGAGKKHTDVAEQDKRKAPKKLSYGNKPSVTNEKIAPKVVDDDLETRGFWDKGTRNEPLRFKPVVGWLVCTRGLYRGQSFPIFEGKNSIGRSQSLSIYLEREASVSRKTHAIVAFDPKDNQFYVLPGDSNELCYLNGNVVLSGTQLKKNDRISLGETTLMLIPCCDDSFSWLRKGD